MRTRNRIEVIAYSGSRGEETPRSLILEGRRIDVVRILKRCIEEDRESKKIRRAFHVQGDDGCILKIHFDEETKEWFSGDEKGEE